MTASQSAATPEIVGIFSSRDQFEQAVKSLTGMGFAHDDLSVLSSHQSIEAGSSKERSWRDVLVGLTGELSYEGPLVAAGLIALASGPIGVLVSGLVAAEVGGMALKDMFSTLVARPKSEEFAHALAAGHVILWVRVRDVLQEGRATEVLNKYGARDVHRCERPTA